MGLMDILTGMQNGPRGATSRQGNESGGGMSPITMALLGLLAYKAIKSFTGGQATANPGAPPSGGAVNPGVPGGGGLGDLLQGGLGSLFGGRNAGNVVSGGLNDLLKQFQQNGHGDVASSWIGSGPNKAISPNDLANALGADRIDALKRRFPEARIEAIVPSLEDVFVTLTYGIMKASQ